MELNLVLQIRLKFCLLVDLLLQFVHF